MHEVRRFTRFLLALKREAGEDDLTGLAAELAFRFFMALFPFALVLVTLGALISRLVGVDDPSGSVLDAVGDSLPADAASVLRTQVDEVISKANVGILSIGILAAVWSAAGGAKALMKATNRVYDLPETRKGPMQAAIALGITTLGGIGLLLAVAAMVLTQTFAGDLAAALGLGREFAWTVQIVRLPLIVFFVACAAEIMYWLAPNRWERPLLASRGAVIFALCWSVFTVGFAFYVSHFGSYNATYGALAGVVIMLFWFYVSSLLILLGAEVNSMAEKRMVVSPEVLAEADAAYPLARARGGGGSTGLEWAVLAGVFLALFSWLRRGPKS
ncbi:MAG: YihY/virulence factor BrkB family protein [bacterium]